MVPSLLATNDIDRLACAEGRKHKVMRTHMQLDGEPWEQGLPETSAPNPVITVRCMAPQHRVEQFLVQSHLGPWCRKSC